MNKEGTDYLIGFTTNKGLMLDLDKTTKKEAKQIATYYCKKFKLEGYMIIKSSPFNYHVIFNKYLQWRTTCEYLMSIAWRYYYHEHGEKAGLIRWCMLQVIKQSETLRISKKYKKSKPCIIEESGKTNKLIRDYREYIQIMNRTMEKETN